MLMFGMLHHFLLLAWICLCVCGNPILLPDFTPTQDSNCESRCISSVTTAGSTHATDVESGPTDVEHTTGSLVLNGGGDTDSHGQPEGTDRVTQTGNGDSLDERSRLAEAGSQRSEVKRVESVFEMGDAQRQSEPASEMPAEDTFAPTGGRKHLGTEVSTTRMHLDPDGPPQLSKDHRSEQTKIHGLHEASLLDEELETTLPSTTEQLSPAERIQTAATHNPIPPSVFISPQTTTTVPVWSNDGATISSLLDPLLPEIGPNLMPKEDGPESLWTEAARPSGVDTVVPLSLDEATEGTMSSEALSLIFEPFEDVTSEAAVITPVPGGAQPPATMATGGMSVSEPGLDLDQLDTMDTVSDGPPSRAPPQLMPDWTSPWQTSGAELVEANGSSGPAVSAEREGHSEKGAMRTPSLEESLAITRASVTSSQHAVTMVTMTTHHPAHKSRSGFEEMESEEETDEDEEDENSEESVEDESEEDLTETPKTSSTQPPYSLIPPPPVWVQRNQGLMRSWVELIREKAGYVSGMLAPVGIGITGALLIVGALYSIRMIHRKRRNSFKHQRRKVRQPEQPREPGTSGQDQAMLLADSSEDEF
ncbi:uncharacterized protein V6R79_013773 [Siganus canaliculatus]